jgi:hypothetical protein
MTTLHGFLSIYGEITPEITEDLFKDGGDSTSEA